MNIPSGAFSLETETHLLPHQIGFNRIILMKKISIRARLASVFGIILLQVVGTGWYTHYRLVEIDQQAIALKSDTVEGLYRISRLQEAVTLDHLATATRQPATERQAAGARVEQALKDYEGTIVTTEDRRAFDKFQSALASYKEARARSREDATEGARDLTAPLAAVFGALREVAATNHKNGAATADRIDYQLDSVARIMVITLFLLSICALLGYRRLVGVIMVPLRQLTRNMDVMRQGDFTQRVAIVRQDEFGELGEGFNRMADEVMALVGQVQRSGIRVGTSMTEIAATSKQQQATAAEVAATTTQIGATSREISATSKELVRTMTDVVSVSEHAASLATGGQMELAHMEETMQQVMEAAGSINAKLAVLNERAGDINQMVTTITKVADQTNLLSLNAAIEAEKAGEYGRGFAVVSSEIRRLADQTAVATYDIEQMVKDIQSAVSASVMGMDKFSEEVRRGLHDVHEIGAKLSAIISEVQALAPRFESVSEGMQMQATGAEQISEALVQLTDATQQTVESLRQSSDAIDELNQVSGSLQGSISRFKLAAA